MKKKKHPGTLCQDIIDPGMWTFDKKKLSEPDEFNEWCKKFKKEEDAKATFLFLKDRLDGMCGGHAPESPTYQALPLQASYTGINIDVEWVMEDGC